MIDCHAHISTEDSLDFLERAKNAGVVGIINIATNSDELATALLLAGREGLPKIYAAAAVTPHDAAKEMPGFFSAIQKAARDKKLLAIGETGLDYFYEYAPKTVQQRSFCEHIELAIQENLPLQIHCRDAFGDLYSIFDSFEKLPKVMLHCFTGTKEEAKAAIDRGFYISLSGIVTFKKSTQLQEVAQYVPEKALILETDSPYLAPQSYRGKKNEPAFIVETARFVAGIKNIPFDALVRRVTDNAKTLFTI
jgi:TatD DNase family protein